MDRGTFFYFVLFYFLKLIVGVWVSATVQREQVPQRGIPGRTHQGMSHHMTRHMMIT